MNSQISPFEYVSILVSIILGLGITQILSSFSDLLYNSKKVKYYWPHTIWIIFILFLHIQDWFITYQLTGIKVWYLPELIFVLLYPISLFTTAKMLLPTNEVEKNDDMKKYYFSQYPTIFLLIGLCITLSIVFNILLLRNSIQDQLILLLFLTVMLLVGGLKLRSEFLHKIIAFIICISSIITIVLENKTWVIK
jgi:hypothetical protein